MLSLSEDLLFVWEPPYLVMLWRAPCLPKWKWMGDGGGGRWNFSKKSCGGLENF